jgi:hypothetical protein
MRAPTNKRSWVLHILVPVLLVAALAVVSATTSTPPAPRYANGLGLTPAMGWTSWSFLRQHPTATKVEAQAAAMVTSGLAHVGYRYVNLDDFWYVCPGKQGPAVDRYGRWVPRSSLPPGPNGLSGIAVVAKYVHSLGLKFGLYVTPGISDQAVAKDTPVLGADGRASGYTADQIADPKTTEYNFNCGGMVALNYRSPGAQEFIDSWADEFASWGVDYLKLDGVGSFDVPDIEAWSAALRQTGRPIYLELSNTLNNNYASTWERYANGWRTDADIECYCSKDKTSYPLTDWANVKARFDQVANWQPYGRPAGFNDYDSIEVGNGADDGLTVAQRETQLSLWALASSPLVAGADLTHLKRGDLALLENTDVIAVDQDGIDCSRVVKSSTSQVFAKTEKGGDVIIGLFNTTGAREYISTSAALVGMAKSKWYKLDNLWSRLTGETTGVIDAEVAPGGVALFRVTATR